MTISIPTGLVVTFYPDTFLGKNKQTKLKFRTIHFFYFLSGVKPTQAHQPHKIVCKQYYPYSSKGFHACEQSRLNAYEESSRIIDAEGHVMIFKRNGEITVC